MHPQMAPSAHSRWRRKSAHLAPAAPPPVLFFDPVNRSNSIQVAATWTWTPSNKYHHGTPSKRNRNPRHLRAFTEQDTRLPGAPAPAWIPKRSTGLALPDKVLRLHCSPAERAQFTAPKREPFDRSNGATSRLQRSRSFDSFEPAQFLKSATVSPLSTAAATLSTVSLADSLLTDSTFNVAAMPGTDQRHGRSDSRKISLDEFRSRVTSNEHSFDERRPRSSRRPSFRRALSIINDVPPPLPSSGIETPRRKSFTNRKRATLAVTPPEMSGPSQYYQDPDARMKLKLLLSSPKDFEEVIEHGFPASPITPVSATAPNFSRPRANTTNVSNNAKASSDVQRFLRNDILSLFEDNDDLEREVMAAADEVAHEDDDESIGDLDSPITPHDADSLKPVRMSHGVSGNPTFFFPESVVSGSKSRHSSSRRPSESQFDLGGGGVPWPPREMTLRMTLTKPELRAPEEAMYGVHGGSDPLALDDLPQLEDHAAFKRENKGLKFWRKVKPSQKR